MGICHGMQLVLHTTRGCLKTEPQPCGERHNVNVHYLTGQRGSLHAFEGRLTHFSAGWGFSRVLSLVTVAMENMSLLLCSVFCTLGSMLNPSQWV